MFGGAGGYSNPYVPSDIEIRRNHLYKPATWLPMTTGRQPREWTVEDNLECKSCLRLVATGNVMENAWHSGQYGTNVELTVRTYQSGYTAVVDDITIQSNILKNANMSFSIIGYDNICGTAQAPNCTIPGESKRVVITNNIILTRDPSLAATYHPMAFSMGHRMDNYLIQHNTIQGMNGSQSWNTVFFNQAQCPSLLDQPTNVWILDNVLSRQVTGDCKYLGQRAMDSYMPLPAPDGGRFIGNVMFVPSTDQLASWPAHNDATTVPLVFADPLNGNYELVSPYWVDTYDGTLSGVDMNALNQAMNP